MFKRQVAAVFTVVLAMAGSACSANEARPVSAASGSLACAGGTVHSEADAARFEGCETIIGDLRISESELFDVAAFKQLRRVSGTLLVENNSKLTSLAGLASVEQAQAILIRNNRVLAAYPSLLPGLKHVERNVVLDANRGLSKRQVSAFIERIHASAGRVTANETVASVN